MKIITKSEDRTTYLCKIDKTEHEVIQYVIEHDDFFNKHFDVMSNSTECVIIKKEDMSVDDCIKYLNHCFANEMISLVIRGEKIK
jgi:hypothetical protein